MRARFVPRNVCLSDAARPGANPQWITRSGTSSKVLAPYFSGEEGTISGLTLPQSDARNFAVNVLSNAMFTGLPWVVPVTVVWLVPLKCSASVKWKSMCPSEPSFSLMSLPHQGRRNSGNCSPR
jgi:hypothetical protein